MAPADSAAAVVLPRVAVASFLPLQLAALETVKPGDGEGPVQGETIQSTGTRSKTGGGCQR